MLLLTGTVTRRLADASRLAKAVMEVQARETKRMCRESVGRLSPSYLLSNTQRPMSVLLAITKMPDEPGAKQEDPQLQVPPLLRP